VSAFPVIRLRRFRRTAPLRGLVRETRLALDQFVMPFFVAPEPLPNEALPGMSRYRDRRGLRRPRPRGRATPRGVIS
jgi:delta-aminolevulinic acid dehydratase/porphobilinogen synthase